MTQHAVLDAAKELLAQAKSKQANALKTINNVSIWFVPVLNPDGLKYVLSSDRMWRKNRAQNSGGSKGVDLNRNYGVKWGACGLNSSDPSSEVYKGPAPDSEAEVILNEKLNAKLRFQYSISYHSYGNEVLYPYVCGTLAETRVYEEGRDGLKSLLSFGHRPASSSGEDHEYHYNKFGTLAFLLEIGDEFQPDFNVYKNEIWPNVKKVVPYLAEQSLNQFTQIRIEDADTAQAVRGATLSLQQIQFKENEVRTTDSFGSYRWRLSDGNYNLSVIGAGYENQVSSFKTGLQGAIVVKLQKALRVFPNLRAAFFPG